MARRRGILGKLIWKAEWSVANFLWKIKPIRYTAILVAIGGSIFLYKDFFLSLLG